MGEMKDCYPYLLQTIVAFYPPTFMHWIWAFIRPLMPAHVLDKLDLIEHATNEKERDRLLQPVSLENLPIDFGWLMQRLLRTGEY
jgi:CRAL/TRIO domain